MPTRSRYSLYLAEQHGVWGSRGVVGGAQIPGAVIAYGLPNKIPTPQNIIKELPKEQLKDVPKDVLAQVAPSEGISPISYGVIGVGSVLIVMAGVLFTRRKKAYGDYSPTLIF